MRRPFPALLWLVILAPLSGSGCANFVETRAISAFAKALDEGNVETLKDSTSSRFNEKSLRLPSAIEDLAILRLPKGDVEVVEVDEVSATEKRVTVEIGESRQKLRYRLLREPESRQWVVDDVFIRQKKDGVSSTRPVTELMDLVSSVREFLAAWGGGYREDMLQLADERLATVLSELPRPWLQKLAEQAIGDRAGDTKIRPEAQIDDDVAVVRLPRKSGQMLISFRRTDQRWLISDLAVESRRDKDHIPSVKQFATAMLTATRFLEAYSRNDKTALQPVTTPAFFEHSITPATLSLLPLPDSSVAAADFQIRLSGGVADFVVNRAEDIVKLSLTRVEGEDSETPTQFLVEDVTLYDLETRDEKRLSALFMSHALVDVFSEALSSRDFDTVRFMSTSDFQTRVWSLLDAPLLQRLPLPEIEAVPARITATLFMGAVTNVTVEQGQRVLVYVLRDQDGELLVDDVLLPVEGRPRSLKENLEAYIPVIQFGVAIRRGDLDALQRTSSNSLNGMVWHQVKQIPALPRHPADHLAAPLSGLESSGNEAVVTLGDDRFGARVLLVRQGEANGFVVDDIRLIAGPEESQRTDMKSALRFELSRFRRPNEQLEDIRKPAQSRIIRRESLDAPVSEVIEPAGGAVTPASGPLPEFTPPGE